MVTSRCGVCGRLVRLLADGTLARHGGEFRSCGGSYCDPAPSVVFDPEDHEPFASEARAADERWESGDRHTITAEEFRERLSDGDG